MCRKQSRRGRGLSATAFLQRPPRYHVLYIGRLLCIIQYSPICNLILDPLNGHREHRLAIRQVGRIHKSSDALLGLGLAQVHPEGCSVAQHVPAHGFCWIAEEVSGLAMT